MFAWPTQGRSPRPTGSVSSPGSCSSYWITVGTTDVSSFLGLFTQMSTVSQAGPPHGSMRRSNCRPIRAGQHAPLHADAVARRTLGQQRLHGDRERARRVDEGVPDLVEALGRQQLDGALVVVPLVEALAAAREQDAASTWESGAPSGVASGMLVSKTWLVPGLPSGRWRTSIV